MLLGKEAEEAIEARKRLVIYVCKRRLNESVTPSLERMVSKVLAERKGGPSPNNQIERDAD